MAKPKKPTEVQVWELRYAANHEDGVLHPIRRRDVRRRMQDAEWVDHEGRITPAGRAVIGFDAQPKEGK